MAPFRTGIGNPRAFLEPGSYREPALPPQPARSFAARAARQPQVLKSHREITYRGRPQVSSSFSMSRSEEHTSELQSHLNLVCRLLLQKKNKTTTYTTSNHLHP